MDNTDSVKLISLEEQTSFNTSLEGKDVREYDNLSGIPSINGHTLIGDMTSEDLSLQPAGDFATHNELEAVRACIPTFVYDENTETLEIFTNDGT